MISIVLFFLVYIVLVVLSVLLAIGCVYAGFTVMAVSGHILGIIAGAGIISIGIMVFIFLVKFIFSVKKYNEEGSLPVTEKDQPGLFEFIKKLTADTQTAFPKKIILTPEVNASVFYNDSFWSMIFPVRKNLNIGLGLVNSLTLSEFKAVMAHEFGHFSQRSMKLGSFVYNVNKAVYNMLYENKDYGNFLEKWGSLHWAIGIFVWVTVQIVKGIQYLLQAMYGFINKNYMSLSREMEFHADAVAASVSGSQNCISALRKIEIADVCYGTVLGKANELLKDKAVLGNIYKNHDTVMLTYADYNNLPIENCTPVADDSFFRKFILHKVNIKDQWASHPPREEREKHLQELGVASAKDTRPAWTVFNNPEALQNLMSKSIYRNVPENLHEQKLNAAAFTEKYKKDIVAYSLPEEFNGFYDNRQLNSFEVDELYKRPVDPTVSKKGFEALFSNDWTGLAQKIAGLEQDIATLKAIVDKQVDIKSFDYDGKKMDKDAAAGMLGSLEKELEEQKKKIGQHEEEIASYFFSAASLKGNVEFTALREKYISHFTNREWIEKFLAAAQRVMNTLAPLMNGQQVSIEQAVQMATALREESSGIKPFMRKWLEAGVYNADTETKQTAERFVAADYVYFNSPDFFDKELKDLHLVVNETLYLVNDHQFKNFKTLLHTQLELVKGLP